MTVAVNPAVIVPAVIPAGIAPQPSPKVKMQATALPAMQRAPTATPTPTEAIGDATLIPVLYMNSKSDV